MKKTYYVPAIILAVFCMFALGGNTVFAATTPGLGVSASYAVLSSTYTNTLGGTTVNGDLGFTTGPAMVPGGVHTNYGLVGAYATAGSDQGNALTNLNNQACTFTFASGAIDLSTDTTHGAIGVYTPGVYCTSGPGAASIGTGGITLNGNGTYIFKVNGALTTVANSVVTLSSGASACDVFWAPTGATTLAANSTFKGTDIDNAGITLGDNVNWIGRALSFNGTVTTGANDTITAPSCSVAPAPVVPPANATLFVIKQVVNNNGGVSLASNFNLSVKLSGNDVIGSPAAGVAAPGTSYSLAAGTYVVGENSSSAYTQSFSGDCDANGNIVLASGNVRTCIITNDDVAQAVVTPPVVPAVVVPVVVPTLPATGFPHEKADGTWKISVPVGILMVIAAFYIARKRSII